MIVFFSDISWDALHQRPQQLASRLAREGPLLWVEPATLGRRHYYTPVGLEGGLFRITLPMFPLNARSRRVKRIAGTLSRIGLLRRFLASLQRILLRRGIRMAGGERERVAFLVENFQLMHLVDCIPSAYVVFDYIDDAFGFTDFPPFVRTLWEHAVRRADVVTATSPTLAHRLQSVTPREVRIIHNGVEYDRFSAAGGTAERPADLPPAGQPVVGYIGSVYPWIDYDLLAGTVPAMPDVQFIMIGHDHPDVGEHIARLRTFSNFHFLGVRPYSTIPLYLRHVDAGIIPFRRTTLTEGVNPVKLYEYSAAGVPTVTTDFSDDTQAFSDVVLIARSQEEFIRHIRTALLRRSQPAFVHTLHTFARANDWDSRSRAFADLLRTHT